MNFFVLESDQPFNVRGTELLVSDTRERYRQKLARITLDSMVQFVGLLDAKGTVLEINQVALDAVGIQLSDVEGKPFWTTFWWRVSEEIRATLRESIQRAAQGEFVRWDTEIYGRAGGRETIIIDASLCPVKDDRGDVVFITAEGRDITEKKAHEREIARQREELAKLDELKTQFFANISHEFRTPLTLMMGPIEDAMAQPEGLSASNREQLALAHRNSIRLLKLVNTLLDFSRIEAGRMEASYEPTDLSLLTQELASVFRSATERAGIRLIIDCPPLPEMVYVDREMWEKVMLNLLSNAFKFTFEGEIEVSLHLADSAAEVAVRDTGTGIPADEIPHLFERFHRLKGARGRSYEGSGIGLALVQELVKLHGGNVRVESEVNSGSRFVVSLPLGKAHLPAERIQAARALRSTALTAQAYVDEAERWSPEGSEAPAREGLAPEPPVGTAQSAEAGPAIRKELVILADDNADMRDYLSHLLRDEYRVHAVRDGLKAIEATRQMRPALVLTDVMMPGLDGFGVLSAIRSDPSLSSTPVVLLSARAGEESRVEGLQAGADDYLVKPFTARELMARVATHIKMANLRREATGREERLRAEAELERHRLQDLLAQAPAGIGLMSGPEHRWTYVNEHYVHMTGRNSAADFLGKTLLESLPEIETQGFRALLDEVYRTGEPYIGRTMKMNLNRTAAGQPEEAYFDFIYQPVRNAEGKVEGMLVHAVEVTDKVAAHKAVVQSEKLAATGRMAAAVAHEINNPLESLMNLIFLARQHSSAQGKAHHYLLTAEQELERVSHIARQTLGYYRDTGSPAEVYLHDLIENVLIIYNSKLLAAGISVDTRFNDLQKIVVSRGEMLQILSNIVANAIDAMPRGGALSISTQKLTDSSGEGIQIIIRDNGIGIRQEHLPKVFEPFFTTKGDLGTGIGLWVAKQLVETRGGRISVETGTETGKSGTTITICIPFATPPSAGAGRGDCL